MTTRRYHKRFDVAKGYALDRYVWEAVRPLAATNLATNPSFERGLDNWTKIGTFTTFWGAFDYQRFGVLSLRVRPDTGVNDGCYYGEDEPVALASGTTYYASVWGVFQTDVPYKIYFASTAGAQVGGATSFVGRGNWQRVWVQYTETTTANRRVYITKNNSTNSQPFYLDGFQIEQDRLTDYLDGSLRGFAKGELAYAWTGGPHISPSQRSGSTRSGGEAVKLSQYFSLLAMMGLGMATVNNVAVPLALKGGSDYQRTLAASERVFSLGVEFLEEDGLALEAAIDELVELFSPNPAVQQPFLLRCRYEDGAVVSDEFTIPCLYEEGLEGNRDNYYQDNTELRFKTYLPYIQSGNAGAVVDYSEYLTINSIARRVGGQWQAFGDGLVYGFAGAPRAHAMAVDPKTGNIYIGGTFTDVDLLL